MLILVSTPIGNLSDISKRAIETLNNADIIACEDTRTSAQLFTLLGVKAKKLIPYHEHNADTVRPKILEFLKQGLQIALVSDAGTPLISDPGYRLVRDCRQNNIPVTTVPGANAVLSALQLSGLPSDAFLFAGFLPNKKSARRATLQTHKNVLATLIFYETANRLTDSLNDILDVLGNREMAVVREITKKFEETRTGQISDLISYYTQEGNPKGELVLVISRANEKEQQTEDVDTLIRKTLETCSARDTADLVAKATGIHKKEIYKKVLDIQNAEKKEV
ncbi:MAG: 16S rRNA (cytidine(1402)-2'-O)-methyltransferase [Alphaproteobacteria bacterium]|nr:16S rRNA (cytidine(1402)-2'-O)-methyltransferase [Alphaproteobacteria bacterium]